MRPPQKPLCVIICQPKHNVLNTNNFFASITNPGEKFNIPLSYKGKGPYETMGKLMDNGFRFGSLETKKIPKWVMQIIPQWATCYGIAQITRFPNKNETSRT